MRTSSNHVLIRWQSRIQWMGFSEPTADGESEQRLYLLSAWRESPFYSDRERAALAWTEALTLITDCPS